MRRKCLIAVSCLLLVLVICGCKDKKPEQVSDTPQIVKDYHPEGTQGGAMVRVPAGEFMMGCDDKVEDYCLAEEQPYHAVFLDDFYIDKYEVTVEQYRECFMARVCKEPKKRFDFEKCNWRYPDRGTHPITCVDWEQAKIYCEWAGKRLPTEAEWEKAARGTDGRIYPWGNQRPTCDYLPMKQCKNGCEEITCPVGSKPLGASSYGAMDMAGNVWEYVADWYDGNYYEKSPYKNPKGPSAGEFHIYRGGAYGFGTGGLSLKIYHRSSDDITSIGNSNHGFRCARSF